MNVEQNESYSLRCGKVVSIQIGKTQHYSTETEDGAGSHSWSSAIVKTPVTGPVCCSQNGLDGDEQADRKLHGGPDKAILAYPAEHYAFWEKVYPDREWCSGGFGENVTVTEFDEYSTHIGDVFQIGDCSLQVSEPRQPCYKLARRWKLDDLPNRIIENNRSGWYCRVLRPGKVKAGDQISLLEKGSEWTVAEVAYMIRHVGDDFDRAEQLYQCETLSAFIRNFIRKAIDNHDPRKQPKKPTSFFSFFWRS